MKLSKIAVLSTCLFLSIVGNMALCGLLAGGHYAHRDLAPLSLKPIFHLMKDAPPEERQRIEAIIAPARSDLKEKREALRRQREHIRELMLTQDIDKQQLEEAFTKERRLFNELQDRVQSLMIETAMTLPMEERQRMLEAVGK